MAKFSPVYSLPSLGFTEYLFLSLSLLIIVDGQHYITFRYVGSFISNPKDSVEGQVWAYMESAQATQEQIQPQSLLSTVRPAGWETRP